MTEPSPFRALCAELADQLEAGMAADGTCPQLLQIRVVGTLSEAVLQAYPSELLALLRGLIDVHPAPQPPAEGEVAVLLAKLLALCNPAPVPVSERPPGPKDCDGEGRCWWFCFECPGEHSYWILAKEVYCGPTYWLPVYALPLPQGEVRK